MIKVLILEDEIPARKKLRRLILDLPENVEIVAEIDTVEGAVQFLTNNRVDLIFSDIRLLDGDSFQIFDQVRIACPIIFTTAYDSFLTQAFEANGIAYLLKPFSNDRFRKAWDKYMLLAGKHEEMGALVQRLSDIVAGTKSRKDFKKRFTVHSRQGIYFVETTTIAHFEASDGVVYAYDINGKKHLLTEATLNEIEDQLDPQDFFRINRSVLLQKMHIEKIEYHNKNSLAAKVRGTEKVLIVSQANTPSFRKWVDQ